jgi:Putative auto-transporter adhesin, head GIN domain
MKRVLIFCCLSLILFSCSNITGSGNIVTEKRSVKEFNSISSSGSVDVELIQGDKAEVEVEADDNVIEFVVTKVEGGILKIRTRDVNLFNVHIKVYVTAPLVNSIKASASSTIEVKGTLKSSDRIALTANSSADIIANVDAPEIVTDANSSGTVSISGRTKNHKAEASSSGDVKAYDLFSENTEAHASSSGSVKVHASINLDAKASSSGDIKYRGSPVVKSSTNSSGSIEKE